MGIRQGPAWPSAGSTGPLVYAEGLSAAITCHSPELLAFEAE